MKQQTYPCTRPNVLDWMYNPWPWLIVVWTCLALNIRAVRGSDHAAALPPGVRVAWDIDDAYRQRTGTRERVCVNGLWRWQPAGVNPTVPPNGDWGFFKVPGCWPGITDYMQKDCQSVFMHPSWRNVRMSSVSAAWYEREITVPKDWAGRRVVLSVEYLNSLATVYVDGRHVNKLRFPGGLLELTSHVVPGQTHRLSLHVAALPLQGVMLSYDDTNSARQVRGSVQRRGLCGDAFLESHPANERITDVKIDTSVRKQKLRFEAGLEQLNGNTSYVLVARVSLDGRTVREFHSEDFQASDLHAGRLAFSDNWIPDRLWDIHTPSNVYEITLSLGTVAEPSLAPLGGQQRDAQVLDTAFPQRFGFREFWIDGKDFYLNGSRIFLSAVPLDNAQVGAAWASYDGARESLRRLKSFGVNFVYAHNYGCQPGSHLSFEEILRAADDEGVLVALSQPHFSHYDWRATDAESTNGYARHAEFYVRAAQNHPAVVAYSMSHNACGYAEDMNPDQIDGLRDPRTASYQRRNADRALGAEAIVKRLDPARVVYHHAGGHLGSMHTVNFYPNFVPVQEMSDWFEHWSTVGVKPAFLCEYAAPFKWDWAMYRGWYKGEREFGSAVVPWDFCLAEWNAQFMGDRAFQINEFEKANLRWEAKQFRAGRVWHRWDYPYRLGSNAFPQRYPIIARYITDNWRAYRTWGLSAFSPWEHGVYWRLRDGVNRGRQDQVVDWQSLQRPGFSADYLDQRYERMDLAYDTPDWEPTPAAEALLRNNQPLLAYIAGRAPSFTSKDHLFTAGETVEKQIVLINNSRQTVDCDCSWSFELPNPIVGKQHVTVATGQQMRLPLSWTLPPSTAPGAYRLRAHFEFSDGTKQDDTFSIHVLPAVGLRGNPPRAEATTALFDPHGETAAMLRNAGLEFQAVTAETDLRGFQQLIVGKAALTVDAPAPNIDRMRDGLRVIVFEQTADVLERRFGFRVAEYGLREVFPRVPDHALLSGLGREHLRDWRGSATINSPRLTYDLDPRRGPTVRWCDIEVPRLWRCGNRGNVTSVLIEKPACGDFLPIVDGGFSLQYSPLMEYREGRGMALFCQLDVTGRTESEPAAERLVSNLFAYVASWKPSPQRTVVYVGAEEGRRHLASAGFDLEPHVGTLSSHHVLVVGPGGGQTIADHAEAIRGWLEADGRILAIGLDQKQLDLLPAKVGASQREHIGAHFEAFRSTSPLRGVGPADVHNRDPRQLPLFESGARIFGNGVLATTDDEKIVFCQLVPWQLGDARQWNLKKTYRRSSFLVTRLLANLGATTSTPIVDRFHSPARTEPTDSSGADDNRHHSRWQIGLYLDQPEEWDDPYRFFRW